MKSNAYYESRIKCDVINEFRRHKLIQAGDVVTSEYILGYMGRRVDLAFCNKNKFIGIEIKSKHDSLSRLEDQLSAYIKCFDETIVVVSCSHLEKCLNISPISVGVFEVSENGKFHCHRRPARKNKKSKLECLKLISTGRLKKILRISSSQKIPRSELVIIASDLPEKDIFRENLNIFLNLYKRTSQNFWRKVGDRDIVTEDLAWLSRYSAERAQEIEQLAQHQSYWEAWRFQAEQAFRLDAY